MYAGNTSIIDALRRLKFNAANDEISSTCMMTSSNGNIFRVTGHLCGEFTGPRWIPRTKASDAELWCFLWSAPEKTVEWFETLSHPLWRHCNGLHLHYVKSFHNIWLCKIVHPLSSTSQISHRWKINRIFMVGGYSVTDGLYGDNSIVTAPDPPQYSQKVTTIPPLEQNPLINVHEQSE